MARANLKKNIKGPMKMKNSYVESNKEVKFEGRPKASMKSSASNLKRRPSKLKSGGMAKKCKSGNCAKYQSLGQSM